MTATEPIAYRRPWLYDKQRDAIFCPARTAVVEASTKSGKTVGCLIWLAEQAFQGSAGRNYWWVAPSYTQADMAYRRLRRALPQDLAHPNQTDHTLTLPNGAVLWFKTGEQPDLLYGEDVHAVVIDEASRVRDEAWHAIRSTLTATRGPIRLIGNVKGRKNWFYRLARRAQEGTPDMHYAKLTWRDAVEAGILEEAEVEDAKQQLPDQVFQELYAAEPSDDGGNPFGLQHIDLCINPDGLATGSPQVWGWDLARAHDYTAGIGLNEEGDVCRVEWWHEDWEPTIEKILGHIGSTKALIEQNGVGDAPVELLRKRASNISGFVTTSQSKQALMEGLAVAIQQHRVHFPEGRLARELRSYEYQVTRTGVKYAAVDGAYDDCVMALAIAWHARGHHLVVQTTAMPVENPSHWKGFGPVTERSGRKWGGT